MNFIRRIQNPGRWLLLAMFVVTTAVYWPGLSGGWLFDDYPNIVDNKGVQPDKANIAELTGAALSSPSSRFKRPLSSLSFAANYLVGGLDPWGWKLVNLIIHLLNGLLVYLLARGLLFGLQQSACPARPSGAAEGRTRNPLAAHKDTDLNGNLVDSGSSLRSARNDDGACRVKIAAALIAGAWMLLPINLTGVLYVVQRMESLANLFVLLGLWGYVVGRRRMLGANGKQTHPHPALPLEGEGEKSRAADLTPPLSRGEEARLRATGSRVDERSQGLGGDGVSPSGLPLCIASLIIPTILGLAAKETAVMLPLYAFLIEWIVFRFRGRNRDWGLGIGDSDRDHAAGKTPPPEHVKRLEEGRETRRTDWRIVGVFVLILAIPLTLGLIWMVPSVLNPGTWVTRDFTLGTRLMSEARIVVGYIAWTLLPIPQWLSFYHDNFHISTGLVSPWTTLTSILTLIGMVFSVFWFRLRQPLVSLGIALFLGCHLLTGTILPLELIYEHRNYFASFGLLLALIPLLAAPVSYARSPAETKHEPPPPTGGRIEEGGRSKAAQQATASDPSRAWPAPAEVGGAGSAHGRRASRSEGTRSPPGLAEPLETVSTRVDSGSPLRDVRNDSELQTTRGLANPESPIPNPGALPFPLARGALLASLFLWWTALTLVTAIAWGSPLHLAEELAARAPDSPRAQYELGRTYIIYSNYDADSPFADEVYAPLERAAKLPDASILPEQALIFFNARMHRPIKDIWWDSMIAKLKADPPGVQDNSSLIALTKCARTGSCKLPPGRMLDAFLAALSHPHPKARLLAGYGDYAWNVLNDHQLGLRASRDAAAAEPSEPVYHITLARMYLVLGQTDKTREQIKQLQALNYGGRLNGSIAKLEKQLKEAQEK